MRRGRSSWIATRSVARIFLSAALFCLVGGYARAQNAGVHFNVAFDLSVDCDQPKELHDIPVHGEGGGVLNADKTATADLTLTAITSSTIHFDASLGGQMRPAPGGSGTLRVAGANRLQLIWDLPNNTIITSVGVTGQNCKASVDFKLKYGNHRYSMFDGQSFYFCDKPHLLRSSCTVK